MAFWDALSGGDGGVRQKLRCRPAENMAWRVVSVPESDGFRMDGSVTDHNG